MANSTKVGSLLVCSGRHDPDDEVYLILEEETHKEKQVYKCLLLRSCYTPCGGIYRLSKSLSLKNPNIKIFDREALP